MYAKLILVIVIVALCSSFFNVSIAQVLYTEKISSFGTIYSSPTPTPRMVVGVNWRATWTLTAQDISLFKDAGINYFKFHRFELAPNKDAFLDSFIKAGWKPEQFVIMLPVNVTNALDWINRFKNKVKNWCVGDEIVNRELLPSEYVPVLKQIYTGGKNIDPNCKIGFGSMMKGHTFTPGQAYLYYLFLQDCYGLELNLGDYFDFMSIDPYAFNVSPDQDLDNYRGFTQVLEKLKEIMNAHGDSEKKIWIIEFGYPLEADVGGHPGLESVEPDLTKREQLQADWTIRAMQIATNLGYVERFHYFWWKSPNGPGYGLIQGTTPDTYRLRPVYYAVKDFNR